MEKKEFKKEKKKARKKSLERNIFSEEWEFEPISTAFPFNPEVKFQRKLTKEEEELIKKLRSSYKKID